MDESNFSANAYDLVHSALRPEIFFKSLPKKVVGPGEPVGIRPDAQWNVPEPELALVINSQGTIVGYTVGNDMSSRDIEGENLLYLPQAKIYHRSCAMGPCIVVGSIEKVARTWTITLQIYRGGGIILEGQTAVNQVKRRFEELVSYLYRSQSFPHGAILLTGTVSCLERVSRSSWMTGSGSRSMASESWKTRSSSSEEEVPDFQYLLCKESPVIS